MAHRLTEVNKVFTEMECLNNLNTVINRLLSNSFNNKAEEIKMEVTLLSCPELVAQFSQITPEVLSEEEQLEPVTPMVVMADNNNNRDKILIKISNNNSETSKELE